jgi:hypothetical protein
MSALGMADIAVSILRWVSDDQPGIVEVSLVDSNGCDWRFVGKQAYFTAENLCATSPYPASGTIRCTILALETDAAGRSLARIDTENPGCAEAIDQTHIFEVQADRLDRNVPQIETVDVETVGVETVIETIIITARRRT